MPRYKIMSIFLAAALFVSFSIQNMPNLQVYAANDTLFSESFDDYSDESLRNVWKTDSDTQSNITYEASGKSKGCLKITASGSKPVSCSKTLSSPIDADKFILEFFVKGDAQSRLSFIDESGKDINVLQWEDEKISYSSSGTSRFGTISEISLTDTAERWNKIKLYVDKTSKIYTVVSGNGTVQKSFTTAFNRVCGIKFSLTKSLSKSMCIDELNIIGFDSVEKQSSARLEFVSGNEKSSGAVFVYNDDITDKGLELNCVTGKNSSGGYIVKKDKGVISVDIDGDSVLTCENGKNVFVDIKYQDVGYGWFYLRYKTDGGEIVNTKEVCLYNSGDTITKTFVLCDAAINTSGGGADFADLKILTHKTESDLSNADGYVNSCYSVPISEVNIYQNGTYSPIKTQVSSNNPGNIFFGDETPSFKVDLNNKSTNSQDFSLKYTLNKYDKEMTKSEIHSEIKNFSISADSNKSFNITAPNDEYGLYNLEISISDSGNIKQETITVPFSRCIKNTQTNASMGTNLHVTNPDQGDADIALSLMKNAGMGTLRGVIAWYYYEKTPGVYKLTDRQEALLDAAEKYNIDVLLIPLGRNGIYDGMLSNPTLMTKEAAVHYGDFVYNLLKEDKIRRTVKKIEIWNEPDIGISNTDPDKEVDATNVSNSENYRYRAKLYTDMLIEAYKGAVKAEKEVGADYLIGGFSMQNYWWWTSGRRFLDCALDYLKKSPDAAMYNNGQFFDVFSIHPYYGKDTENGYEGTYVTNQFDGVAAEIESYKGLITGGMEFGANNVDKWTKAKGAVTGNTYDFKLKDGAWCTEFGLSTAMFSNGVSTGMKEVGTDADSNPIYEKQADRDWQQAIKLMRGFDVIKTADPANKVWFYDFIDDGVRDNEHEYKFGMLNNWEDDVPYSAKYSYLAASAYNKLTEGATKSEMFDDYMKYTDNPENGRKYSTLTFISKYTTPKRKVYMMRTTKSEPQYIRPWEICQGKGFSTNINNLKFYDMLGNRIDSAQIVSGNKFKVTREPYYVVEGDATDIDGDSDIPKISFIKDNDTENVYETISKDEINISSFKFMIDFEKTTEPSDYKVIIALYDDDRLVQTLYKYKYSGVTSGGNKKVFSVNGIKSDTKFDKLKIIAVEDTKNIKPIARAFESIREE